MNVALLKAAQRQGLSPQRGWRLLAPVIVGGGDGLEVDGDDLRSRGQRIRVLRVDRAQFLAHGRVGLGVFDAAAAEGDREFEPLLRGGGDQGGKPCVCHWTIPFDGRF